MWQHKCTNYTVKTQRGKHGGAQGGPDFWHGDQQCTAEVWTEHRNINELMLTGR